MNEPLSKEMVEHLRNIRDTQAAERRLDEEDLGLSLLQDEVHAVMTGDTLQTAELQHAFSRIAALESQLKQARDERDEARRLAWFNDFRPIINAIGEISVQEAMNAIERDL